MEANMIELKGTASKAFDPDERFNVWVFIEVPGEGEIHDKVGEWLEIEEAVKLFESYIRPERPAQMLGIIGAVMITDGGDLCCALWNKGKGMVWPKPDVEH
jgi:hypothetical protein